MVFCRADAQMKTQTTVNTMDMRMIQMPCLLVALLGLVTTFQPTARHYSGRQDSECLAFATRRKQVFDCGELRVVPRVRHT